MPVDFGFLVVPADAAGVPDADLYAELAAFLTSRSEPASWALTDPEAIVPWTKAELIGSPETVARRVEAPVAAGFDHLSLHSALPGPPPAHQHRWTLRFAREVAPQFNPAFGQT